MKQRNIYALMTAGGAIGMLAAFMQTLEKITLLKNSEAALTCDLNSVFSCSNVLNAWQSSVFGFPNSLMCLALFTIFATSGLAGLLASKLSRGFRLTVQGLSLFTLGFALWFLWQSTYRISSLCLYCLFCFSGLLLVNGAWLRLNATDLPIGVRARSTLKRAIGSGADIFIWVLLALLVGFAMLLRFS